MGAFYKQLEGHTSRCKPCLSEESKARWTEDRRNLSKQRRKDLIAAGKCPGHPKESLAPGKKTCQKCFDKALDNAQKRYLALKTQKLCITCSKTPARNGRVQCQECGDRSSKLRIELVQRNVQVRLRQNLSRRIRCALQGTAKSEATIKMIGCSVERLRQHLESLFQDGMTWENYGLRGWHIDHIRPVSSFDLSLPEEQQKAFHYSNLQPLWAEDNMKKSDRWGGPCR